MRRQPFVLFALFLAISSWVLWARGSATQTVAANEPYAIAQNSPQPTPTPLPPMPTPSMTRQVEADWQSYTSPYLGFSFRYPPDWSVEGPEIRIERYNLPEAARYGNLVGSPTWLSPVSGKLGSIYIILNSHRISPNGSLAEWVSLQNEWSGLNGLWGWSRTDLAALPAEYLPEGVDQGVYTVNDRPYNAPKVVWLQRGDFVYSFGSTYNRPEEVALILAVIQTLEFDPTVDETLRDSGGFQGTEEYFHQQLEPMWTAAATTPDPTPACDEACENLARHIENYIVPMETANALPAIERPKAQFIEPLPVEEDWPTYEQALMGISFRHPPGWTVEDPFKQYDMDESGVLRTAITLYPEGEPSNRKFSIILSPYTISNGTPLTNWVAINDQRTRGPSNSYLAYNLSIPPDASYLPRQARDLVHIQLSYGDSQANSIWVSMDNLVYWFLIQDSTALPEVGAVLSTLEFDEEQLEKLHAEAPFVGDERQMVREMVNSWVTPTLAPTPTPTATVRATVTPSAFESPLVNGLQQYHGNADDEARTPYRLLFDPAIWQWVADEQGTHYLTHQQLEGCELAPGRLVYEVPPLAPVELAGQGWAIGYLAYDGDVARALMYSVGWEGGYFQSILSLSEPLREPYDPKNKQQCQLDAEAVLDTFTYQPVPPTPTGTPTLSGPHALLPTITPTPG